MQYNGNLKESVKSKFNSAISKINSCKSYHINIPSDFEGSGTINSALTKLKAANLEAIKGEFERIAAQNEEIERKALENASGFEFLSSFFNIANKKDKKDQKNKKDKKDKKDNHDIYHQLKKDKDKNASVSVKTLMNSLMNFVKNISNPEEKTTRANKSNNNYNYPYNVQPTKSSGYMYNLDHLTQKQKDKINQGVKKDAHNKNLVNAFEVLQLADRYIVDKFKYGIALTAAQVADGCANYFVASIANEDPNYWENLRKSGVSEDYIKQQKKLSAQFREEHINPLLYSRANNSFTKRIKNSFINPDDNYNKDIARINKKYKTNYTGKSGKMIGDFSQTARRSFTNSCSLCCRSSYCYSYCYSYACFKKRC